MKRILGSIILLAISCLATGCLQFEKQTMSYRHDKAADEIRIFQDYHGIFGNGLGFFGEEAEVAVGKAHRPLSDDEQAQLASVLADQRTFFFANWIWEYDRSGLESLLEDLDESEVPAKDQAALKKLINLTIANVTIKNGCFYFDDDDKLSAVQSVTISKVSELVANLNGCKPIFLEWLLTEEGISPADRKAIETFSKADTDFLQVNGNALVFRFPMSRAIFDEYQGADAIDPLELKMLKDAGFGIAWEADVVTYSIGNKEDKITSLTLDQSEGKYVPNAVPAVRKQQAIEKEFDVEAAKREFLD